MIRGCCGGMVKGVCERERERGVSVIKFLVEGRNRPDGMCLSSTHLILALTGIERSSSYSQPVVVGQSELSLVEKSKQKICN